MFIRSECDKEFREKGFKILPDISQSMLYGLKTYFEDEVQKSMIAKDEMLFVSVLSDSVSIRQNHHHKIKGILQEYIESVFDGMKAVLATYFVKRKSDFSVGPHQDPSIVDVNRFDDFSLWIPLEDTVGEGTGRLIVYPKTHLTNNQIVVSGEHNPITLSGEAIACKKVLDVKKGGVVLFYNRLVHESEPNLIYENRAAVSVKVVPSEASLITYERDLDKGLLRPISRDDNYFLDNGFTSDKSYKKPV